MWLLFQQPDEYLDRFYEERRRSERTAQFTRALRDSTPPLDSPMQRRSTDALAMTDQRYGRFAPHRS
jgi:hypothetical protein